MKLLTFQHRNILNDIKACGVYYCKQASEYRTRTPNAYKFLRRELQRIYPFEFNNIIFAWQRLYFGCDIDVTQAERALECTGFPDDYYMLELDFYTPHVLLTNFYNFVDLRCQEEGIDDLFPDGEFFYSEEEKIRFLEEKVLDTSTHSEVQAIIPYIKAENIITVRQIKYNETHYEFYEPFCIER